jgi:hypothetical protein
MTVSRQQNLFAAEDWKVAYKAYTQIDFQAYDFDTIRNSLVNYVKLNYPENFNDYIESSEFIAIIELLAYLSQTLAFRMDVNTRENFLETAERRDSVFKLARMLGYNPKRNIPASGLLKITSVKTTQPIVDSLGNQLDNQRIYWDDTNDPQSYEQFLLVINNAISKTNRFTSPSKQGTVNGVNTELYQLNTPVNSPVAYNFEARPNGVSRRFNLVNADFIDDGYFYERHPDASNRFNLIYRNDSKGLSSKNTGFFFMFRQGELLFQDYNYTTPVISRVEDVLIPNIAENDLYFQEIDSVGLPLNKWERVQNTTGQTLNFNSKSLDSRNLYAVENLGNDGIRLRFPDGNFGNVPNGLYRLWHRVSDPVRYVISPQDIRNISINLPYEDTQGKRQTLTVTMSLQYTVQNSLPAESINAIKDRAPQSFYTQNRMVSAEDYNVFPQTQSSNIKKLKATNRTHAGHSRYIDINDPTGTYHNVDTFADDAYLYSDYAPITQLVTVNSTSTPTDLATTVIPNLLKKQQVNNFVYHTARNIWKDPNQNGSLTNFEFQASDAIEWQPLPTRATGKTGYFTEKFSTGERNVLLNNVDYSRRMVANTFLKVVNPTDRTEYKWVRIVQVLYNGQLTAGVNTARGPWTLSEEVPAGWQVTDTVVTIRKQFTVQEINDIVFEIAQRRTFALGFNLTQDRWYIINSLTSDNRTGEYQLDVDQAGSNSWIVLMEYQPIDLNTYAYALTLRGENYVVQSKQDIRFYNITNIKTVGSDNRTGSDSITFTPANTQPGETEIFKWQGTSWLNTTTGTTHTPGGLRVDLPLKTRDTNFQDVSTQWISNFGIFQLPAGNNVSDFVIKNRYVTETIVPLNTYKPVGGITSEANVVVGNNTGTVVSLPSKITVQFNDNTFGSVIVNDSLATPFIVYRQIPADGGPGSEVIFKAELGADPVSWGSDGLLEDPTTLGRLYFTAYDSGTGEGTLEYRDIQLNDLHSSADRTARVYQDQFSVYYLHNNARLELPLDWQVTDVFTETDGYTDPRKVKVSPIDTDGDLVPDRPLQFSEYVGPRDLVLFEYYTDLDGYIYDRPVSGVIYDYRESEDIRVDGINDIISPSNFRENKSISAADWILVKNLSSAQRLENIQVASGVVVYVEAESKTYQLLPLSTDSSQILLTETDQFFVKEGRGKTQNTADPVQEDGVIRWSHIAPNNVRIDPSISNVVDMLVLSQTYYDEVLKWQARPTVNFPLEPTSDELSAELSGLNTYKAASDTLAFRSAKFKLLFGEQAEDTYKAKFRVVKLSDQLSDNELKTRIISAINEYFSVDNWEFGETFFFTEMSTFIHQKLGSAVGSIVILPRTITGQFGELFQVKAEPDELFISTATVNDIELVSRLDSQTLKIDS